MIQSQNQSKKFIYPLSSFPFFFWGVINLWFTYHYHLMALIINTPQCIGLPSTKYYHNFFALQFQQSISSPTSRHMEPRGILRNKDADVPAHFHDSASGDLDRQEVIRNTRYNAQLVSESSKGDMIRAQIAEARLKNGVEGHDHEHLKWDEINLYKTEQEKAATMKIDEPKTPYEGGFDPTGEYYQEDEQNEPIPDFNLGEGQFQSGQQEPQSLYGGQVIKNDDEGDEIYDGNDGEDSDDEVETRAMLAEERHKHFEELRKAHYRNAANPLRQKILIPDEDLEDLHDEGDDEGDE